MKSQSEVERLELMLIEMIESQSLNEEDYNLIFKYLVKVKNDLVTL